MEFSDLVLFLVSVFGLKLLLVRELNEVEDFEIQMFFFYQVKYFYSFNDWLYIDKLVFVFVIILYVQMYYFWIGNMLFVNVIFVDVLDVLCRWC